MERLPKPLEDKLAALAHAIVDQRAARLIVAPNEPQSGFWFGGGNMVEDAKGEFYLVGRYRNQGDSRTGLGQGERGLELAIFHSADRGETFQKVFSFSKSDLHVGTREVLSIEGSALHLTEDGVELFVSSEKAGVGYPDGLVDYLKPGAGVWSIELLQALSITEFKDGDVETIMELHDPRFVHVKDPSIYARDDGSLVMFFCTHPFCWSSSNSAYSMRRPYEQAFDWPHCEFFPRGFTWDVAITRVTAVVDVPRVSAFSNRRVSLVFYDGGESLRNPDQHAQAVQRPRGYSCEEIGGVGYFVDGHFDRIQRLSINLPFFISPTGTGCSRYVDVLSTDEGLYATWQQSQDDLSQPLVLNFLAREKIEALLA